MWFAGSSSLCKALNTQSVTFGAALTKLYLGF